MLLLPEIRLAIFMSQAGNQVISLQLQNIIQSALNNGLAINVGAPTSQQIRDVLVDSSNSYLVYGDSNIYVSKFNSSGTNQWTNTYTSPEAFNNDDQQVLKFTMIRFTSMDIQMALGLVRAD